MSRCWRGDPAGGHAVNGPRWRRRTARGPPPATKRPPKTGRVRLAGLVERPLAVAGQRLGSAVEDRDPAVHLRRRMEPERELGDDAEVPATNPECRLAVDADSARTVT